MTETKYGTLEALLEYLGDARMGADSATFTLDDCHDGKPCSFLFHAPQLRADLRDALALMHTARGFGWQAGKGEQ